MTSSRPSRMPVSRTPFATALLAALLFGCSGCKAPANDAPLQDNPAPKASKPDPKHKGPTFPVRVTDATERAKMQTFVSSIANPATVAHSFRLGSGPEVDCVDAQQQAAVRLGKVTQAVTAPSRPAPGRRQARTMAVPAMVKKHPVRPAAHVSGKDDEGRERKCPAGTVPVRRVELAEVTAFKTMASFNRKSAPPTKRGLHAQYAFGQTSKHEHAVAGMEDVPNHGAHAIFNIWNPPVEVEANGDYGEFSLAQLWVVGYSGSRPYAQLQTLEAGFQVWPERYGDNEARLFVFSTSDGYAETGCYEPCGRFVQTASNVVIGGPLPCYSQTNSEQCEVELSWWQSSEGWWLYVNDEPIGYYPTSLYAADGLANGSNSVMFGGEIVDDRTQHPGRHTKTRMGSGAQPGKGYESAAYVRDIYYYDTSFAAQPATQLYPMRDTESPSCYDVSSVTSDPGAWGTFFFFGGPGYSSDCP